MMDSGVSQAWMGPQDAPLLSFTVKPGTDISSSKTQCALRSLQSCHRAAGQRFYTLSMQVSLQGRVVTWDSCLIATRNDGFAHSQSPQTFSSLMQRVVVMKSSAAYITKYRMKQSSGIVITCNVSTSQYFWCSQCSQEISVSG